MEGANLSSTGPAREQISWLMPLAPGEDPELLAGTLSSLAGQSLQADELLIAADGQLPTALLEVINDCPLPWRLHNQNINQGIGATLATVAPLCRGEFILRIDSDDLYAPEHSAALVAAMRADPQLGVVGCQLLELDLDCGLQTSARRVPTDPAKALRWLSWRNPLNHQTVAVRREALMVAGGYRHCPGFEDWDLWLRIAAAGYLLRSLPGCTAAARVNSLHLERRRGWRYVLQEINFYRLQIRERRIGAVVGLLACLCRMPWRVLPRPLLQYWMRSQLRGSPAINTSWFTQFLAKPPRPQIRAQ